MIFHEPFTLSTEFLLTIVDDVNTEQSWGYYFEKSQEHCSFMIAILKITIAKFKDLFWKRPLVL